MSLIRWNNILYGVHFLVLAEAASPSKFGDFIPLSSCAVYESNQSQCLLANLLTTHNRARQGLFLGMVMYAYEFKTKEKQKLAEIKINCNKYNGLYQRTLLIRSRLSASMQHKLLLSLLVAVSLVSIPFFQGNVEGCCRRRHSK